MKHLIITCLLIFVTGNLTAQTETKRPSWSQGLPERQTSPQPGKPSFNIDESKPTLQSQPHIETQRTITPEIEIELTTQPKLELNVQPETEPQPKIDTVRRAGYRRLQQSGPVAQDTNPLHEQYSWTLLKTTPIDIPARHAAKNQLKVRIFINPDGEVIRVAAGAPDVPALMLKQAQKSIENWRFDPPKDIGISDNLSKIFTIEIKTG